jgi:hypothetical protein
MKSNHKGIEGHRYRVEVKRTVELNWFCRAYKESVIAETVLGLFFLQHDTVVTDCIVRVGSFVGLLVLRDSLYISSCRLASCLFSHRRVVLCMLFLSCCIIM